MHHWLFVAFICKILEYFMMDHPPYFMDKILVHILITSESIMNFRIYLTYCIIYFLCWTSIQVSLNSKIIEFYNHEWHHHIILFIPNVAWRNTLLKGTMFLFLVRCETIITTSGFFFSLELSNIVSNESKTKRTHILLLSMRIKIVFIISCKNKKG